MISIKLNGTDVSSFITACDDIPVVNRNRDFSLVAEGFSLTLSFNAGVTPAKGQSLSVYNDLQAIYTGHVQKVSENFDQDEYELEIVNALFKLQNHLAEPPKLKKLIAQTNIFDNGKAFTADTANDLCMSADHGLSTDQPIILMNSGGTLPSPLLDNRYYYAFYEGDDSFKLRVKPDDLDFVNITSAGSGEHRFVIPNLGLYNYYDNEGCPNVNLSWLLKHCFAVSGLSLDTSLIDNVILFTMNVAGVPKDFAFNEVYLDENMFYALNQDNAMNSTKISDRVNYEYFKSVPDLFQFVSLICSVFGLVPELTGVSVNPSFRLRFNSTPVYSIQDKDKLSYKRDIIPAESEDGYSVLMKYDPDRTKYQNAAETSIDAVRSETWGNARNEIEWMNNLRFLLKDKRAGAVTGDVLPTSEYDYPLTELIFWLTRPFKFDYEREKIETPPVFTNHSVMENFVNAGKGVSVILQEDVV